MVFGLEGFRALDPEQVPASSGFDETFGTRDPSGLQCGNSVRKCTVKGSFMGQPCICCFTLGTRACSRKKNERAWLFADIFDSHLNLHSNACSALVSHHTLNFETPQA